MAGGGLTEAEVERLREAGFDTRLVEAITQEAQTLRFLWVRRTGLGSIIGFAAVFGGAILANLLDDLPGLLGALIPIAVPVVMVVLGVGPWYELQALKGSDRARWAARRLAAWAVTARIEADNENWRRLVTYAGVAGEARTAQQALGRIADAIDAGDRVTAASGSSTDGDSEPTQAAQAEPASQPHAQPLAAPRATPPAPPQRRNPAPSRATPPSSDSLAPDARDRLFDAVRGAVIGAALLVLLILVLIRRQLGV